jgi:hypothetical protein
MADDSKEMTASDALKSAQESHDKVTSLLNEAGQHLNNASDMMDHIESRLPTVKGDSPLPQRRPIALGPDAAGNNRASKWYGKD